MVYFFFAGAFSGGVDVSEFEAYWKLADEVVREIRMRILERTRLTASAGQLKGISCFRDSNLAASSA